VVYAAAATLILLAAGKWVLPVRPRIAVLLAAAPLLFTGKATITGGVYAPLDILYFAEPFASMRPATLTDARTPLLSDVVCSMIPWQKAVRDALLRGRAPLWNATILSGEPLLAVQQPAVLHPGTWLGLLLPLPQAWTFQMSLRLLVALLSAFLFLRDIGCRNTSALLGAAAWGLSDFMIFWVGYPVAAAIGPSPLLVLALGRLARDADRRAVVLTTAVLVLIVTAGHPEMLLFAVAAGGLCFLFQLAQAPRGRWRAVALSLVAGAFALGLTAIQLLPLAEAVPQTFEHAVRSWWSHQPKSVDLAMSARRATILAVPYAYGVSGRGATYHDFGSPAAYAGAIMFPLAWTGVFSRHRWRTLLVVLALLGAALWTRLVGVTDVLAKLPLFDIAVLDYLVFLTIFAVAVLAALGCDRLLAGEGTGAFLAGSGLTALSIAGLYSLRETKMEQLGLTPAYLHGRLAGALAPLLLGGLVVAAAARNRLPQRVAAGALLGIVVLSRVAEGSLFYPTLSAEAFYPHLPVLDAIPRGRPERVVGLGPALIPNASTLYGLEDVRGYESLTLLRYRATYDLWCRPLPAWFNIVEDLRPPFLSFLNVRWAIVPHGGAPPPGWTLRASTPGGDLLENGAALPRAFVPETFRSVPDDSRTLDVLKSIRDFSKEGVYAVATTERVGEPVKNGTARVRIADYRPDALDLAIEADELTLVGTSIPAWDGWKATLDGNRVELKIYNAAFLAFRVPAGRHRVELRYLPDGFRAGMIVSLLTLAGSVLLLRRSRPESRRRSA
jgi:hypothetical protein